MNQTLYNDRQEAGQKLASFLSSFNNSKDTIVLGLPRGGIAVASVIKKALSLPLDVIVARKIGAPNNKELAIGALAEAQVFLDNDLIEALSVSRKYLDEAIQLEKQEAERRTTLYRKNKPPINLKEKTVILVDDGIATGSTMKVSISAIKKMGAKKIIVAIPVGPLETINHLKTLVDDVICPHTPDSFLAIGEFYHSFKQLTDEEVTNLLQSKESDGEIKIPFDSKFLLGTLSIPNDAIGLVLFAHGSGSSHKSPRNQSVATFFQEQKIGTLLFDLLTEEEEASQDLRFEIPLLSERLILATNWIKEKSNLPLGYFGASTGAAAALVAASKTSPQAIVSRGGRPDLAETALSNVTTPTLLIVGSLDTEVIELNKTALKELQCKKKLALIDGATHLFEEPGTLEEVSSQAAQWFQAHFTHQT